MRYVLLGVLCGIGVLFILHQIRLMLRESRAAKAPPDRVDAPGAAHRAAPSGINVGWSESGGIVIVHAGGEDIVLVVPPQTDATAIELVGRAPELGKHVSHAIFVNDPALGGYLWASELCERLGLQPAQLYATAPDHPIDRPPATQAIDKPLTGQPLRGTLEIGELDVQLLAPNALYLATTDEDLVIGVAIDDGVLAKLDDLGGQPLRVLGSVAGPIQSLDALGALSRGNLTVLASVPPGIEPPLIQFYQRMGVTVNLVRPATPPPPWVAKATALVEAARDQDASALRDKLAEHGVDAVPHALAVLSITNELDVATTIGDAALAHSDTPALRVALANLAALQRDDDAAERHLRAALARDPAHGPALVDLAATLLRRPDVEARREAVGLADRAAEQMPDDPIARRAPIHARLFTDDIAGARAKLAELEPKLAEVDRVRMRAMIDAYADGARPRRVAAFPALAAIAAERANGLVDQQQWDEAIPLLQRAHELDPTSVEIAADLGFTLSKAGRETEAIAHYNRAIDELPEGNLLRINRGNARRRTGDLDGSIADYRFLLERAPTLHDARIALFGALVEAKRLSDARTELVALEAAQLPEDLLATLREHLQAASSSAA